MLRYKTGIAASHSGGKAMAVYLSGESLEPNRRELARYYAGEFDPSRESAEQWLFERVRQARGSFLRKASAASAPRAEAHAPVVEPPPRRAEAPPPAYVPPPEPTPVPKSAAREPVAPPPAPEPVPVPPWRPSAWVSRR